MNAGSLLILQLIGAGGFGALIGWYVYYINRYRKSDVQIGDLTTIIGAVGGAAVAGIFGKETPLFGAYGIGLFVGFFGYFLVLIFLVWRSQNFDWDWFLDGRRKRPPEPYYIPGDVASTVRPMIMAPTIEPQSAAISSAIAATASAVASALGHPPQAVAANFAQAAHVPTGRAADIISVCEAEWPANKGECNAFVNAVASEFNVTLHGLADAIVSEIQGPGWEPIVNGIAAKDAADQGKLVIAGLKGADHHPPREHGHVVVVVSGPLDSTHHKYPTGYWGTLNGEGERAKTINWAWRKEDRDRVVYAGRTV